MEIALEHFVQGLAGPWLFLLIAAIIAVLAKSADRLVHEAVFLSLRWKLPKAVVGATVVSLGTTMPEAVISVLAAVRGSPGLALGNAVGSIICDTGLILGIGILIRPMRLERKVVNRQGWIQLSAGALLVLFSLPFGSLSRIFSEGGRLPQWVGFLFLALLVLYIFKSIQWSRQEGVVSSAHGEQATGQSGSSAAVARLTVAIGFVVGASWMLIPAVKEAALRLHVPEGVIAATLVAFGTSLPELVTVVAASLRGHSELALGNIIGADILNVLFVAGAAAAVTPGGLTAGPDFFRLLFPAMLGVLIIFRLGVFASTDTLKRPIGVLLLGTYVAVTAMSYLFR